MDKYQKIFLLFWGLLLLGMFLFTFMARARENNDDKKSKVIISLTKDLSAQQWSIVSIDDYFKVSVQGAGIQYR